MNFRETLMPRTIPQQPKAGDLIQYRLKIGTFCCNTTRKVVEVIGKGKRLIVEGKGNPTIEARDVIAILRTIPVS